MSKLIQYASCRFPYDTNNRGALPIMLPYAPTAGNVSFLAISSNAVLPNLCYDNQGNEYSLITSNTANASVKIGLYAAVITQNGINNGKPNYPGGYLEPVAYHTATSIQLTGCAFEVNLTGAALSTIQAAVGTARTGTTAAATVGSITFSGNGISIGVFGWGGASAGTITPGTGYQLICSIDWQNFVAVGLAVVVKDNDTSSPASPSITMQNAGVSWASCGATATAPAAIVVGQANTPNGIPALNLNGNYTINLSGLNTNWPLNGNVIAVSGAVTLISQNVLTPNTANINIQASSTRGQFWITDTTTNANIVRGGTHSLMVKMYGDGSKWRSSQYWYAANTGNNSNNGTTPQTAFADIPTVLGATYSNPYDVILLNGGDTFSCPSPQFPSGYIFWTSYGQSNAIINMSGNTGPAIESLGYGQWFSYLNVVNPINAPYFASFSGNLYVNFNQDTNSHSEGMIVDNVTMSGGMVGITYVYKGAGTGSHVILTNNNFYAIYAGAIRASASSGTVSDVQIINNLLDNMIGYNLTTTETGNGISIGGNSNGNYYVNPTVNINRCIYNTIRNWGSGVAGLGGGTNGIILYYCDGFNVEGNLVVGGYYNSDTASIDCDSATTNCNVRYNFCSACNAVHYYTFSSYYGCRYAWNIGVDGGVQVKNLGVLSFDNTMRAYAWCNTLISNNCYGIYVESVGQSQILNNLVITSSGQPSIYINQGSLPQFQVVDGNCTQAGTGLIYNKMNSVICTDIPTWKTTLQATGLQGVNEQGPFSSQLFDPDPYITDFLAINIPTIAARYAPVVGSAAAVTPLNFVSTYASLLGIASLEPFDIGGNSTQNIGAIGAIAIPSSTYATTYDNTIMSLNPYSRYRLGEQSAIPGLNTGRVYDIMWNQYPAVGNTANIGFGASGLIPTSNRDSISFNGTNQRVFYQSTAQDITNSISISVWVEGGFSSNSIIFQSNTTTNPGIILRTSGGFLSFILTDKQTGVTFTGSTTFATLTGVLYHIVAIWQAGSNPVIYVNGVSQPVTVTGTNPTHGIYYKGISIAGNSAGNLYGLTGSVEDIAIFPGTVLTANQVASLYQSVFPVSGKGYPFFPQQFYGGPPITMTPSPNNPLRVLTGGIILAGGSIANNFETLNYPYLGIRNSYKDNSVYQGLLIGGITTGLANGLFGTVVKGRYIILTFTPYIAGLSTNILTSPSRYNRQSANLSIGWVNTKQIAAGGGWWYLNGMPVAPMNSRDNIGKEAYPGSYALPNRLTTLAGGKLPALQTTAAKND